MKETTSTTTVAYDCKAGVKHWKAGLRKVDLLVARRAGLSARLAGVVPSWATDVPTSARAPGAIGGRNNIGCLPWG